MKTIALLLCLASSAAMAQTYDLTLNLGGQTYAGQFTWSVAGDAFSNVSISDPYAGTLTSAWDPAFDSGHGSTSYELWFAGANGKGALAVSLSNQLGGSSAPVNYALAYTGSGSLDYNECYVCSATVTEVAQGLLKAPEIDASSGVGAVMLLGCGLLIFTARGRRV